MIAPRLAYRNLVGAGLRTWLSVIVLSISYVIIIWQNGLLDGWNQQALTDMIDWEIGGGQYWHQNYDPYDAFSLEESRATVPPEIAGLADNSAAPILIVQGTIYPNGRMQSAVLKGISPEQKVVKLPTAQLQGDIGEIPVLIGTRMAKDSNLESGDTFVIRWRDANGTFDAADARVVGLMKTNVSTVDQGQVWLPLERLQTMMQLPGMATIIVINKEIALPEAQPGWVFRDPEFLSSDHTAMIEMKKASGLVLYAILMSLALLAIFDTQVLAIFKRRKEIGTLIALGMTRTEVIYLFTLEGSMHGVLAAIVAAAYGIPLLAYSANYGMAMPQAVDSFGLSIAERIFPIYGAGLIIGTTLIVMLAVTIVSFIPAREIAFLNPTDAIKGKIS